MPIVKGITVKVTYTVSLGDIEIPDKVLDEIHKSMGEFAKIELNGADYKQAEHWLLDNIKEQDCLDWSADIEECS